MLGSRFYKLQRAQLKERTVSAALQHLDLVFPAMVALLPICSESDAILGVSPAKKMRNYCANHFCETQSRSNTASLTLASRKRGRRATAQKKFVPLLILEAIFDSKTKSRSSDCPIRSMIGSVLFVGRLRSPGKRIAPYRHILPWPVVDTWLANSPRSQTLEY